jgi:hypothetical protein
VALNYSYDEVIDSYIEKNKDKSNITFLTGKNKVSRFSSMLTSNRIDTIIGDKYVIGWEVKKQR